MDEEKRQKLIEQRKREQAEKELGNDLAYDLHLVNKENDLKSISRSKKNNYVKSAILFFGTLIPLYVFIFIPYWIFNFLWGAHLAKVGLAIEEFMPYLLGAILLAATLSVFQRKSLLDSFFDYFSN